MSKNNLIVLGVVIVLLFGLFALVDSGGERSQSANDVQLFADLDARNVSRVKIEKGADAVELQFQDGKWTLPARNAFRADAGRVQSLLLKIGDLSVSQKVPTTAENFAALGVDNEAVKTGHARISFMDKDGKELGALILGEERKKTSGKGTGVGQYIRRAGREEVYLRAEPIVPFTKVTEWLDSVLTTELQVNVSSITQSRITDKGEEIEFELVRKGSDPASPLELKEGPAPGQEVKDAALAQVRSGLENLRMSDVLGAGDEKARNLKFDSKTVIKMTNGLTYTVLTAVQSAGEKKYFAKINAAIDADIVKALEDKKREEPKADAVKTDDASKAETPEAPKATVLPVTADEVAKVNGRFQSWVFELPEYLASKFRQTRGDLVQAKDKKSEPAKK